MSAHRGAAFGLDHVRERFDPIEMSIMRPESGLKGYLILFILCDNKPTELYLLGLYLCGQDTMCAGFVPSLAASLVCASSIVDQRFQTAVDLFKLMKKTE